MLESQPFDIQSLHDAYGRGVDVRAVIEECYRRIGAAGDPGIFLHVTDKADALLAANQLGPFDPATKPLWGVPFAIKDNIDAAGTLTTAACPDYAYRAAMDAFVVHTLQEAGGILVGKTNLDQFATGLVGVRTPYPVPRNALDPEIVPGGSSSGSAVAVALGIVSFALGTDTAGSGRVPAALNGIVGLKPTLGAFSNTGVVPACLSLDAVSVMALTVEDAYRVFRTGAAFDETDSFSRPVSTPPLTAPPLRFRVGVPDERSREFFGDDIQAASFADALTLLERMGGEITEIDMQPFYDVARMLYGGVWVAERYAVIEGLLQDHPEAIHPVTREVIRAAERFSAVDTFRSLYRLKAIKRDIDPILDGIDLLCVPSIPTFYTLAELEADPFEPNARLGTYTNFVNLLDLCGMTVPTVPRSDGRPGSVTLLAKAGRDASVAAIAQTLQQLAGAPLGATGWPMPQPSIAAPAPHADEIALAVVGAHMSGLSLNNELTRLGGRFLKTAKTAANYRLYALAGGPPARPGLLNTVDGASIDLEVWAIPASNFGEFIRRVPRPLGIGTLELDDGSEVKGFLCEALAVQGAEDVTHFGGWRAYLKEQSTNQFQSKESSHA
jgi:allophanate hydrolase